MSKEKRHIVYPYIPNTRVKAREEMLKAVDAKDEKELFDTIPEELLLNRPLDIPKALLDEVSLERHGKKLLNKNEHGENNLMFLGGGCAPHYVPAIVDEVIGRSELLTSYSGSGNVDVGKSQLIFEYTSMMAELVDMDTLTMSQVCGGESTASALRMATRLTKRNKVILPKNMNPSYLELIENYCDSIEDGNSLKLEFEFVDYNKDTGEIDLEDLKNKMSDEIAGVYIQNPNYLGIIETQVDEIKNITDEYDSEFIVYVDPITLGVMEAPGTYGATIVCGDIHSLGLHMSAGSGVAGFIAVKDEEEYMFNMKDIMFGYSPSIVEGEFNYSYTTAWDRTMYGSREQGVEYAGTSAALWTMAAGVYMATMGPKGMYDIGKTIMQQSQYAAKKIGEIDGVEVLFISPFFKEFVVNFDKTNKSVKEIHEQMRKEKIFAGLDISETFSELGESALFCITEIHTKDDIDKLVSSLETVLLN